MLKNVNLKYPEIIRMSTCLLASSSVFTKQEKISKIIYEEFGGRGGPYPFTYFVAGNPDSRWLLNPFDRNNDWLIQFRKIETKLLENEICAEIGIQRMAKPLSEG